MAGNKLLSVNQFAELSRTTRDTLHHYDKLGLLTPTLRGSNKYRYYSGGQLAVINLIRTLQELGLSLNEIKELKDKRTPKSLPETLTQRIEQIDAKIQAWIDSRSLLLTLQKSIRSALDVDEQSITIQSLPKEAIILGAQNDYSNGGNDYDALLDFYRQVSAKYPKMNLNYPVWGRFSAERIKKRDWIWPDRYYFYSPEGDNQRPAAQYAVGYTRGGYGQSDNVFTRLIDYIEQNGFEICGDTYEEYPLNELCITDTSNYLIRVMITVCKKQ